MNECIDKEEIKQQTIEQLFRQYSIWEKLNASQQELLKEKAKWNIYQEGRLVTNTGSECLGLFLVCHGTLRVYLTSEDGKEATVCRLHEGELCMLSGFCLLSSIPFDVQIDAEEDSGVYLLPTGTIKKIMDENIYMENFIYKMMNESFSDIIAAVQKMLFTSLEQRVAEFLLDEARRCQSDQVLMTQEQIARAIGSAREAVSRTLKQMAKEETVEVFRGGVRILNRKKLYQKL
ncbi:MAG: Crp/Fnr family transcriptional regulator [Clostridia bacterium]|nr:Crp/Fnr family transcriptional regulator [Clostridia bacterium]NCC44947.1 Crp/Fnr family transcriptional regulator [Clostridia bacterium]